LAGWRRSATGLQISNRPWVGSNPPVVCVELSCVRATSSNGVALLFAAHGFNEQIFAADEQVRGRGFGSTRECRVGRLITSPALLNLPRSQWLELFS